jgi:hypothetical protein
MLEHHLEVLINEQTAGFIPIDPVALHYRESNRSSSYSQDCAVVKSVRQVGWQYSKQLLIHLRPWLNFFR